MYIRYMCIDNIDFYQAEVERNNEQQKLKEMSEEKFKLFLDHHRAVDELQNIQSKYEQLKIKVNRDSVSSPSTSWKIRFQDGFSRFTSLLSII